MDPRRNPYAPGAGTPPPELAGRDELLEEAAIALDRIRNRLAAKSLMIVGLRGTGKTVLLNRIVVDAEARGFTTLFLEAPEKLSLPGLLAPALRTALLKMSRRQAAAGATRRALRALGGPAHGDTAFTVPMFDEYLRRVMPEPQQPLQPSLAG